MPSSAVLPALFTLSLHDALPIWPWKSRIVMSLVSIWICRSVGRAIFIIRTAMSRLSTEHSWSTTTRPAPRWVGRSAASPSPRVFLDRKSTRLNSSHITISYAVFCGPPCALHSFPTRRSSDLALEISYRYEFGLNLDLPFSWSGNLYYSHSYEQAQYRAFMVNDNAASAALGWSVGGITKPASVPRSEEHTSELQSHHDLVCRLLRSSLRSSLFPYTTLFRSGPGNLVSL